MAKSSLCSPLSASLLLLSFPMKAKKSQDWALFGLGFRPGGFLDEPCTGSPTEGQRPPRRPGVPAPSLQHDAHTAPRTRTQVVCHTHVCPRQEAQPFAVAVPTTGKHFDFHLSCLRCQKGRLWPAGKEECVNTGVGTTSTKRAGRLGWVQRAQRCQRDDPLLLGDIPLLLGVFSVPARAAATVS